MQGIFLDGRRPKSKKAIREAVADDASRIIVEATSWFGNEFDGRLTDAGHGTITFVGPDPHTDRRFYGTITITPAGYTVK